MFCLNSLCSRCASWTSSKDVTWLQCRIHGLSQDQLIRICILTRKVCTFICWGWSRCTSELEAHRSGAHRGQGETLSWVFLFWAERYGLSRNNTTLGIHWEKLQMLRGGHKIVYLWSFSLFLTAYCLSTERRYPDLVLFLFLLKADVFHC